MENRIYVSAITNDDEVISFKVLSNEEGPLVETEKEKEKETKHVAADKGKSVEKVVDSKYTEPLSMVLELTETPLSDEESMSIDDILKRIPEEMMLPSYTAIEPTKIKFGHVALNQSLCGSVVALNQLLLLVRSDVVVFSCNRSVLSVASGTSREGFVALLDPAAGLGDQLSTESMNMLIVTLVATTGSNGDISHTSSLGVLVKPAVGRKDDAVLYVI
ncbi:dynein heavy chain 5 [Dorcoceras hygrometricum]|uniref:Dynein heavy chain 5 n=1 Tax=Dorcoceras hygrometricum TaxID=472368 RepID=A0A2Z7D7U2_9LAMI|nr:dynein heavy chain 5 [Dorcoceras hygrometricum]